MSDKLKKKGSGQHRPEKVPQFAINGRLGGICKACGTRFTKNKHNQGYCTRVCQKTFQGLASKIGQEALIGGIETVDKMRDLCRGATFNRRSVMKDTRIEKSPRLTRVFTVLSNCQPQTTLEVQDKIKYPGAATIISAVRWNLRDRPKKDLPKKFRGYRFKATRRLDRKDGTTVFVHQLEVVGGGR